MTVQQSSEWRFKNESKPRKAEFAEGVEDLAEAYNKFMDLY